MKMEEFKEGVQPSLNFDKEKETKEQRIEFESFNSFSDIKHFEDDLRTPQNTEIFFLDENNNYVDEEKAVKSVIRVLDKNGTLIQEIWGTPNKPKEETIEDGVEFIRIFIDDNGNEVQEEEATQVIFRTIKDGSILTENVYSIGKIEGRPSLWRDEETDKWLSF